MEPYRHQNLLVGDIQTHYLEAGQGPDLVLLHGGEYGASAENTWKFSIGGLAEKFHVVAPDMLGYGLTDKIYSFSDPAGLRIRHLKRLLEANGITKAFFVGNSAGGGTILRAAVMEPLPFQIERMVTICGNAGVFKTASQAAIEDYIPSLENMERLMSFLFHDKKWLSREFVKERYETSLIPGTWEALSAARLRRPGYQSASNTDAFVKKLSSLRIPLLIMSCDHDPLNQKDWDTKSQKIIEGSKIHRFKHSAHEPQIEEAEEFNRIVTEFLLSS
ncbi:MAG: alpha/beta fold hydrolase [Candidatus Binatia bacterium]